MYFDVLLKFEIVLYIILFGLLLMNFFYYSQMSDVEQGGGTVFTAINISLWPKKGSAAFWYNLKPNGEGDYKTRHAACPVLTGSKWGKYINTVNKNFIVLL